MSKNLTREIIAETAIVHAELPQPPTVDRTFELPAALYVVTASLYLGFLAVMAIGLSTPGLIIPITICMVFVGMFFSVPAMWARMRPDNPVKALAWDRFLSQGIATYTGRLSAGEAAAQMLVLPILIFAWGVAMVTIAALV